MKSGPLIVGGSPIGIDVAAAAVRLAVAEAQVRPPGPTRRRRRCSRPVGRPTARPRARCWYAAVRQAGLELFAYQVPQSSRAPLRLVTFTWPETGPGHLPENLRGNQ
jgi:hypothetical protein